MSAPTELQTVLVNLTADHKAEDKPKSPRYASNGNPQTYGMGPSTQTLTGPTKMHPHMAVIKWAIAETAILAPV